MKYEVWVLFNKVNHVREVMLSKFNRLDAASDYAYKTSCIVFDTDAEAINLYLNINGFRKKIASYDVRKK